MGSYNTTGILQKSPAASAGKAEDANAAVKVETMEISKLDALQMLLDVVGLIPGAGAPADILNGLVSAARGDWLGAGLSLLGAVPIAGEAAVAAKIAKNADRYAAAVRKVADEVLPHLPKGVQKKLRETIDAAEKKIQELGGKAEAPKGKASDGPEAENKGKGGEKIKGDPCQPLENGVPGDGYRGGKHGKIKEGGYGYDPKRESHHMPADSSYDKINGRAVSSDGKPTIQMDKADHKQTASWGSSAAAKAYRNTQSALMKSGKVGFMQAVMMDIADVRGKFGDKYDGAIAQYLAWAKCKGFL